MTGGMFSLLLVPVIGLLTEARMAVVRSTTTSEESALSALSVLSELRSNSSAPHTPGRVTGGPRRPFNPIPGPWRPMLQQLQHLGSGTFGVVTKVRTSCGDDERLLVLKVAMSPNAGASEAAQLAEMMNERHVMAELNHPSIAREVEFYPKELPRNAPNQRGWDGQLAILMEYFPGNSLYESFTMWPLWNAPMHTMEEGWHQTRLEIFAHIGKQLLAGVAEMHRHGILHMDLKPHNVLVKTPNTQCLKDPATCEVKLADFGMACYNGLSSDRPHLNPCRSAIRGTPAYIAPELYGLDLMKSLDRRSSMDATYRQRTGVPMHGPDGKYPGKSVSVDSWAIGLILYQLWNRELPRQTNMPRDAKGNIAADFNDVKRMSQIEGAVTVGGQGAPVEFRRAVRGLLSFDPATRTTPAQAEKLWDEAMAKMRDLKPASPGITDPQMKAWADPNLPACWHACQSVPDSGRSTRTTGTTTRTCGEEQACFTQGRDAPACYQNRCLAPFSPMPTPNGRGGFECLSSCKGAEEDSGCNYNSGVCRTTSMQREGAGAWQISPSMDCVPHEPLAKCLGGEFMFDGCHRASNQHVGFIVDPLLSAAAHLGQTMFGETATMFGETATNVASNVQQLISPGCGCHSHLGYEMECVTKGPHGSSLDEHANFVHRSTALQEGHCMYIGG